MKILILTLIEASESRKLLYKNQQKLKYEQKQKRRWFHNIQIMSNQSFVLNDL